MDIITGRVQPDSGSVEIAIHSIGYFDQHSEALLEALNENQRVIDYIKEVGEFVKVADGTQISASQMLERFLFPLATSSMHPFISSQAVKTSPISVAHSDQPLMY